MWRDPSPLFPVGAEQRTGGPLSSSSPSSLLGTDTVGATPSVAADAPALAGVPTLRPPRNACGTPARPPQCSNPYCQAPAGRNVRGYCEAHNDGYLAAAYQLTQSIGRGELS